jgi:hypothetical protein
MHSSQTHTYISLGMEERRIRSLATGNVFATSHSISGLICECALSTLTKVSEFIHLIFRIAIPCVGPILAQGVLPNV